MSKNAAMEQTLQKLFQGAGPFDEIFKGLIINEIGRSLGFLCVDFNETDKESLKRCSNKQLTDYAGMLGSSVVLRQRTETAETARQIMQAEKQKQQGGGGYPFSGGGGSAS